MLTTMWYLRCFPKPKCPLFESTISFQCYCQIVLFFSLANSRTSVVRKHIKTNQRRCVTLLRIIHHHNPCHYSFTHPHLSKNMCVQRGRGRNSSFLKLFQLPCCVFTQILWTCTMRTWVICIDSAVQYNGAALWLFIIIIEQQETASASMWTGETYSLLQILVVHWT